MMLVQYDLNLSFRKRRVIKLSHLTDSLFHARKVIINTHWQVIIFPKKELSYSLEEVRFAK